MESRQLSKHLDDADYENDKDRVERNFDKRGDEGG